MFAGLQAIHHYVNIVLQPVSSHGIGVARTSHTIRTAIHLFDFLKFFTQTKEIDISLFGYIFAMIDFSNESLERLVVQGINRTSILSSLQ